MLLNSSSRLLPSKGSEPEVFSPFVEKADELEVEAWVRPTNPNQICLLEVVRRVEKRLEKTVTSSLLGSILSPFHSSTPRSRPVSLWPTPWGKIGVWCLGPGPSTALPGGLGPVPSSPLSLIIFFSEKQRVGQVEGFPDTAADPHGPFLWGLQVLSASIRAGPWSMGVRAA